MAEGERSKRQEREPGEEPRYTSGAYLGQPIAPGDSVQTAPGVMPSSYANKRGVVAEVRLCEPFSDNGSALRCLTPNLHDEVSVEGIAGSRIWFHPYELIKF